MSYTVSVNKDQATFQFEVSSDDFTHELEKDLFKNKEKMNLSVYRNGKVPPEVLQQLYNRDEQLKRVMNHIISREYDASLMDTTINPLTLPNVKVTNCRKGEPFTFTIETTVLPKINLGTYLGIQVAKPQLEVQEDEMDLVIQRMLQEHKKSVEITDRTAMKGDLVYIDFEGFLHGRAFKGNKAERFPLSIGANSFIPGFEDQIIGVGINEAKDFTLTYPSDYRSEELAGKEVVFRVIVRRIVKEEIPVLNDEFVKAYTKSDTVATYKDSLRKALTAQKRIFEMNKKQNAVMKTIVESTPFEVPAALLELEEKGIAKTQELELKKRKITLEKHLKMLNVSKEQYGIQLKQLAMNRLMTRMILLSIAENEKLPVTDEEFTQEARRLAKANNLPVENYMHPFNKHQIYNELKTQKALRLVMDQAIEV